MISAYLSSLYFGGFYFIADVPEIAFPTFAAFGLFVIFGVISFFVNVTDLVILFRASMIVTLLAFYNKAFHTGGILSPAAFELTTAPLLAFFYRPERDRYIFMGISLLCIISLWILTTIGLTPNLLPEDYSLAQSVSIGVFVFAVVTTFAILFRTSISVKNRKLNESMQKLQDTTQKLVESEKMASLGMLSAGVAHEINNPLNFIKGGLEILELELKKLNHDSADMDKCIEVIKEGLKRSSTIVNSLNHFSRETVAMDEKCDLHNILENGITMLMPKLNIQRKRIIREYDASDPVISGNVGKLHQAFLNILSNAEQAIDEEGTITIKTTANQTEVLLEIIDDGVGISKDNLERIGEPFFSTKPAGQGTGLGLAITYRIIEAHKGEIFVNSKVDQGTSFCIAFRS